MKYRTLFRPLLVLALVTCVLQANYAHTQTDMQPPYRGSRRPSTTPSSQPATPVVKKEEADKPDDRYFAVKGAVVHTVSGSVLQQPTVLCKNGKIFAIGYDIVLPEETEVLDAAGYHLYPGLVAVSSSGLVGSEPPENNTNPFSLNMALGLAGGVTTAVTGDTAAKLTFGTLEDHVVRRDLFHTLSYSRSSPSSRERLRKTFERVRQYLRDYQAYEEEKKRDPSVKEPDKSWLKGEYDSAMKLLKHERVALASARTMQDLRDLANLAHQYGFRLVIRDAVEAWTVAPELSRAGVRVVITPRTRRDADDRLNRPNGSSIENARILYDHGVTMAIQPLGSGISTSGLAGRDLMHLPMEAAFAVRGGLPQDAAVRAITFDAAKILGIDHRVGSIEVGKDADFVIVDGDLLHYMTLVRWTVVNGRVAYDEKKEAILDHIRPDGNRDAPPPPDYWPRKLGQ